MKNTERELIEFLSKKVKEHLIKEETEEKKSFIIKEYVPTDETWEYIKVNKQKIWEFLNNGYIYAGYERFCGCDNARSLFKNANLIKIGFLNNEWVSISVYTGYKGGYKNVGITATTDNDLRKYGVDSVHTIIKEDIGNFRDFFWTECSGSVEHLYEKYDGIKIPNEYVFGILQIPINLDSDGFHYTRNIKGEPQRKVIYGFNNKETFEKVLNEREEYINSCIQTILNNQINEAIEKPSFGKLSKLDCAIAIVNFFVDQRWESECYEFPKQSLRELKRQIEIIEYYLKKNLISDDKINIAKLAIDNGKDILETSDIMKLNRF